MDQSTIGIGAHRPKKHPIETRLVLVVASQCKATKGKPMQSHQKIIKATKKLDYSFPRNRVQFIFTQCFLYHNSSSYPP